MSPCLHACIVNSTITPIEISQYISINGGLDGDAGRLKAECHYIYGLRIK